ncbi:hypothetical protein L6452_21714 [Arctium lappa]|uniref:Uncharacterized protein n=1 Tax=Arctium lappa TaxID=4217 RepID=A0ACB9AXT8_ARCLA|nr:hypothetical protein L6452_21714 [Arctium lappa]
MLRSCVIDFGGSWDSHLPLVEFAYNNSYHSSIGMAPFEALYGRKCRTPVCWLEAGEKQFAGLEIVQETTDKVKEIRERLKVAQDRHKSYANKKRRPVEFQVGDRVMLKVSPWKGIIRFGKRVKLSPRFLGPFVILKRIGLQAYRLDLPSEMDGIHPTFHVCYLQKCLAEKESVIPLTEIRVDNGNRCVEEPEAILESKVKKLQHKDVVMDEISETKSQLGGEDCNTRKFIRVCTASNVSGTIVTRDCDMVIIAVSLSREVYREVLGFGDYALAIVPMAMSRGILAHGSARFKTLFPASIHFTTQKSDLGFGWERF